MGKQQAIPDPVADRSGKAAGLIATALVHTAAVYALLVHPPVNPAVVPPTSIMVTLVSQPQPPQPQPSAQSRPREVARRPVQHHPAAAPEATPLITAASSAPATDTIAETRASDMTPSPASPPAVQSPGPVAPAQPVVRASMTEPSFNADYLRNPAPRYPPLARRMGQQGKVMLRVLVDPRGEPAQVVVRSSSGSDLLDEAAVDAVKRWRFVPARQGEQPVTAWVLVPITFTLQG